MDLWNGVTLTMGCTDPILQEHIIQKEGGGVIMSNSKTLFQVTKAFSRVFFLSYSLTNHLFTYRLIAFRKSLLFNVLLLIIDSFEFVYPFLFLYSLFQKFGCLSSIWQNFVWSTENFDCRTPLVSIEILIVETDLSNVLTKWKRNIWK